MRMEEIVAASVPFCDTPPLLDSPRTSCHGGSQQADPWEVLSWQDLLGERCRSSGNALESDRRHFAADSKVVRTVLSAVAGAR
ncbi:hypothetical protein MAMC_01263 [Methylacidimicrobium cyclopophantes]|uniref:Uncharacterized protein n=1 Tax=Methylacidimicrobium cyclopophantes TaxID=1041766 RepID=A0A5E6MBL5_9BACT|nr:hypothetical protein MAMC_01263 [Methylacidimicrobium cyclopophantes]